MACALALGTSGRRTARRLRRRDEDRHRRPAPHRARRPATGTATSHTTSTAYHRLHRQSADPATGTGAAAAQSPSTTRTAPAPRSSGPPRQSPRKRLRRSEAAAAVPVVRAHGYTPEDTSDYHPNQTLRVLIGTRTGSADGYDQRAFFFLDGHYIGTDASQPSASVRVVSQSDTEVTLAYALYRSHDPLCCPSGGQATVHFQLNDGQLVPLEPIPPASSTASRAPVLATSSASCRRLPAPRGVKPLS